MARANISDHLLLILLLSWSEKRRTYERQGRSRTKKREDREVVCRVGLEESGHDGR